MHFILANLHPGLVFTGLLVGILVGLTGMGGGSLMTPMLIFLFGFSPVTAVGTDIVHGALFKSVGAWRHIRLGTVNLRLAALLSLGSVPASIAGVAMTSVVRNRWGANALDVVLKEALGVTLVVVAAILLIRLLVHIRSGAGIPPDHFHITRSYGAKAVAVGIVCGFIVGLTSVGSGTLVGLMMMLIFPLSARRVVGTDVVNAAVMLASAGLAHLAAGNVNVGAIAFLLVGSVPGVVIGAHLVTRFDERPLRGAIGVVIALSGAKLLHAPDAIVAVGLALVLVWMAVIVVKSFFRPLTPIPGAVGP